MLTSSFPSYVSAGKLFLHQRGNNNVYVNEIASRNKKLLFKNDYWGECVTHFLSD